MTVLVIGGTGYVSGAVVEELRAAGHQVTLFTRGERPVPEGVSAIRGDRRDDASFPLHFEGRPFDAVIDCICYHVRDAHSLLRAFGGRVGQVVMISTDFVYGPHRRLPMDEDTPTTALSQYGRNKAAAEDLLLRAFQEERFPATILRPPHVMGAGGHLGTGSLHGRDPQLLDRLLRSEPVVLLDSGALLIQPVFHRDVGRACCAVLGKPATLGQAYNVAGPDCVTTLAYYELVAATLGITDVEYLSLPATDYVAAFPDRAPFAQHRTYCVDKLARDTGYRPATEIRHAIFEMVDWLQAAGRAEPFSESEGDAQVIALCRAFRDEMARVLANDSQPE